jgi:hypothetical protein
MKWSAGYPLHVAGGAAVMLVLLPSSPLWIIPLVTGLLFVWGVIREKWQRRGLRLRLHHWLEALSWPLGAALAAGGWQLWSQ